MPLRVVVIGGGIAGVKAAETVREHLGDAEVTLVSGERTPFYSRPAIYEVLAGLRGPEDIVIHPDDWFDEADIQLLRGVEASRIDLEGRRVELSDGRSVEYDRLVLATGSKPVAPPVEGLGLGGIHGFYTLEDALKVSAELSRSSHVLVLGAGPVGLKVAESIVRRRGSSARVTVVEKLDRPLPRFLDAEAGEMLARLLEDRGVELLLGRSVARFEGDGRVEAAVLDDGRRLECDLAIVSVGVRPNADLAARSGIRVRRGVVVKPSMETSAPGIYAAGDVAEVEGYSPPINPVWPVAYEQGVVAGLNIAGFKTIYKGLPLMNASQIFGKTIISFGEAAEPPPGSTIHVYRRRGSYVKVVRVGGRILGALFFGEEDGAGAMFNLAASGLDIPGLEALLEAAAPGYGPILGLRGLVV